MSYLENTVSSLDSETTINVSQPTSKTTEKDELTISTKKVVTQVSAMPESIKQKKQRFADSLEQMLQQVIEEKGEAAGIRIHKTSEKELEIEGLSKLALHSFLLKAEELGKNIKYTKTLKVEITD